MDPDQAQKLLYYIGYVVVVGPLVLIATKRHWNQRLLSAITIFLSLLFGFRIGGSLGPWADAAIFGVGGAALLVLAYMALRPPPR